MSFSAVEFTPFAGFNNQIICLRQVLFYTMCANATLTFNAHQIPMLNELDLSFIYKMYPVTNSTAINAHHIAGAHAYYALYNSSHKATTFYESFTKTLFNHPTLATATTLAHIHSRFHDAAYVGVHLRDINPDARWTVQRRRRKVLQNATTRILWQHSLPTCDTIEEEIVRAKVSITNVYIASDKKSRKRANMLASTCTNLNILVSEYTVVIDMLTLIHSILFLGNEGSTLSENVALARQPGKTNMLWSIRP